jgi:hypothetical protein
MLQESYGKGTLVKPHSYTYVNREWRMVIRPKLLDAKY